MPKIKQASQYIDGQWTSPVPLGADDSNIDIVGATNPADTTATLAGLDNNDVAVLANTDTDASAWSKFNKFRKRVKNVAGTSITNITRSGTTFTATRMDGTTFTFTQQDNNTTYGTVSKTSAGLCPVLPNENTTTKYLRQDGTWQVPPDNNTTYSAGAGLTLSGTQFKITNAVNGARAGQTTTQNPSYNQTFNIPYVTYNAQGLITDAGTSTVKIPASDNSWRGISDSILGTSTSTSLSLAGARALNAKYHIREGNVNIAEATAKTGGRVIVNSNNVSNLTLPTPGKYLCMATFSLSGSDSIDSYINGVLEYGSGSNIFDSRIIRFNGTNGGGASTFLMANPGTGGTFIRGSCYTFSSLHVQVNLQYVRLTNDGAANYDRDL